MWRNYSLIPAAFLCIIGGLLLNACVRDGEVCRNNTLLQISADNVSDAILYVFDENVLFLDTIHVYADNPSAGKMNRLIPLKYSDHNKITVVGWGNGLQGNQHMPVPTIGTPLESIIVSLKTIANFRSSIYAFSPDDLFFGYLTINQTLNEGEVTYPFPLERIVSSMRITTVGLCEWTGINSSNFTYVVGNTYQSIRFDGILTGTKVGYKPHATFNAANHFVTPVFYTLPSNEEAITIDIYEGTKLVYSVSKDLDGNPLVLKPGKLLDVQIKPIGQGADLEMTFTIKNWGVIDIDQEFGQEHK